MKYKLIKEYPGCLCSIGDEVSTDKLGQYIIEFPLRIFEKEHIENYPEFWEKIKEPLFTTSDGVNINGGDGYYHVHNFKVHKTECAYFPPSGKYLTFSTRKAAEKYIEDNEPRFSKEDMLRFGKVTRHGFAHIEQNYIMDDINRVFDLFIKNKKQ